MQINPLVAMILATHNVRGYHEKPEALEGSEPIEIGEDVWKPSRKRPQHELKMLAQIERLEVTCLKAFPDAQITRIRMPVRPSLDQTG